MGRSMFRLRGMEFHRGRRGPFGGGASGQDAGQGQGPGDGTDALVGGRDAAAARRVGHGRIGPGSGRRPGPRVGHSGGR